jgi:transposase-like protein
MGMGKAYSPEFKQKVLNEVSNRRDTQQTMQQIATRYGVSTFTLYDWASGGVQQARRAARAKELRAEKRNERLEDSKMEVQPKIQVTGTKVPQYVDSKKVMRYFSTEVSRLAQDVQLAAQNGDTWKAFSGFTKMQRVLKDFEDIVTEGVNVHTK